MNGKVVALVADGITGKLKNVTIDLEQTAIELPGTIQLTDRLSLPSSYLTLSLKNMSRTLYDPIGGRVSGYVSGSGPFQFKMTLDPKSLQRNDLYQLQAQIEDSTVARFMFRLRM